MAHYNASDYQAKDRPYLNKARKAVEKYVSTGDPMHLTHARNHLANTTHVGDYGLVLDDLLAKRGTSWRQIQAELERAEQEALWQSIKQDVVWLLQASLAGEMRLYVALTAIKRLGWNDENMAARECGFQDFAALEAVYEKGRLTAKIKATAETGADSDWEELVRDIMATDEFFRLGESMQAFVKEHGGSDEHARLLDEAWTRILSQ
jgi:hypothetical protein